MHDESPISQVSVIWYSGTEGYDTNLTTENSFVTIDDKGKTTLDGYIDNPGRNIDGGTPMGAALKAAYEKLGSAKYSNKYVLLMTDGRPGYASKKGMTTLMDGDMTIGTVWSLTMQLIMQVK